MNLLFIAIILIASVLTFLFFRINAIKEWFADNQVSQATNALLKSPNYYLMKDVVFISKGDRLKFDYLIISQFGLFTVTAIQSSGVIEGAEHDADWSQLINNQKVGKMENPSFKLNKNTHILCNTLNLPRSKVFPIVLFQGISGFKTTMRNQVTYGREYLQYIQSKKRTLFTPKELEDLTLSIKTKRKATQASDKPNGKELAQQNSLKSTTESQCPACGSGMEIREIINTRKMPSQKLVCQLYPTCR